MVTSVLPHLSQKGPVCALLSSSEAPAVGNNDESHFPASKPNYRLEYWNKSQETSQLGEESGMRGLVTGTASSSESPKAAASAS